MLANLRLWALLIGSGALAVWSQELTHLTRAQTTTTEEALIYLPPAERMRHISFGFRELLADLVWIRAVIATGHPSVGQRLDFVSRYLEVISALAPRFRRPYTWGGVVSVYSGRAINRAMLDQSIRLFRQGLDYFPEDHEMLFALGMILYRDLRQIQGYTPQEIAAGAAEGKSLIRKAAAFGAPPLVRQLASSFADSAASDALQIEFLETQLIQAEDETLRLALRKRLAQIGTNRRAGELDALRSDLEGRRLARFPYLSLDHFAVLDDGR